MTATRDDKEWDDSQHDDSKRGDSERAGLLGRALAPGLEGEGGEAHEHAAPRLCERAVRGEDRDDVFLTRGRAAYDRDALVDVVPDDPGARSEFAVHPD